MQNKSVTSKEQMTINRSDFIQKNEGKFKDHYALGGLLGQGSFGEVRKCQARASHGSRAVKIIKKDQMSADELKSF